MARCLHLGVFLSIGFNGTSIETSSTGCVSELAAIGRCPLREFDDVDTGMPLEQDCWAPLVDSPTGHYNIGTHSSSFWLAFLASEQQGRALDRAQHHESTLTRLPKIYQKPPKQRRLDMVDLC